MLCTSRVHIERSKEFGHNEQMQLNCNGHGGGRGDEEARLGCSAPDSASTFHMLLPHIPFRPQINRHFLSLCKPFSVSAALRMKVVPVPVRDDNYAYLLIDDASGKAAAVDPYDVPKVKAAAEKAGVEIVAGLTTHHHFDHSGGNQVCTQRLFTLPYIVLTADHRHLYVSHPHSDCHSTHFPLSYVAGYCISRCAHLRREQQGPSADKTRQGQ